MYKAEEDFLPYKEAIALKGLGFNQPCMGVFSWDGEGGFETCKTVWTDVFDTWTKTPTWRQAFKWFRDNHDLEFHPKKNMDKYYVTYGSWISKLFDTFEEAELECIKKMIEMVKLEKQWQS